MIKTIVAKMKRVTESFSRDRLSRSSAVIAAMALVLFASMPLFTNSVASAYGLVTSRSIEMSDSSASATGVQYAVSFIPSVTSETIGGIVVDFCSNDPILGDSCSTTAALDASVTASPAISPTTPTGFSTSSGTWVASTNGSSPYATLFVTNTTAQTASATSSTPITFTITTAVNPTTSNSTFYARILTYSTSAAALAYTSTAVGTPVDAGGIALSTANNVVITAKVQEQITFCIYETTQTSGSSPGAGDGGNCSGTGSTVTLGNANGVLSSAGPFVDVGTHYDIQTNALHGAVIRFWGPVLTSGSNTIESSSLSGTGSVAATAYASTADAPQFGLCTYAVSGTTANLTAATTYNGGTNCNTVTQTAGFGSVGGNGSATFGFNIASASTYYGDTLATFPSAGGYATGDVAFLGNIANTTIAGIYTTTLKFIATGTY